MYALTVIQPWATLIVHHGKDVENRTWPTRHRGPLLIHAGQKVDITGFDRCAEFDITLPPVSDHSLPAGGIIGQVDVIDCVQDSRSRWAEPEQWHWLLANPRSLAFQPMRGRLGLWLASSDQPSLFD